MIPSAENREKNSGEPIVQPKSFKPIDRRKFSETALSLLDQYRIENANDPMAVLISIVDTMNANQHEAISQFEAAIALAGIEFGRIDLAIEKAEETQKRVETVTKALDMLQKDFISTTNKIRERSNFAIVFNHLSPFIYGLFGAAITLLVAFTILRLRIL
jgi:hypothetical protein